MTDAEERLFTVEQANRMLPLVRRIVRDIVEGHRAWTRAVRSYESAATWARPDAPAETLVALEADVRRIASEIDGFLRELRALGVEFKGFDLGLVDFPGEREGRPVYLCWKLDEDEVLYWHETGDGFAGRQPLVPSREP